MNKLEKEKLEEKLEENLEKVKRVEKVKNLEKVKKLEGYKETPLVCQDLDLVFLYQSWKIAQFNVGEILIGCY